MPTLAIGLGISGLASGAAGVVGHLANASAQERAQMLQQQGVQQWLNTVIPDPAQQKLALQKFVQTGELHPQLENAIWAQDSDFKKVAADPSLKESRLRSLQSLENLGQGGETLQDKAAEEQALIDSGAANRGHQKAIVSDMARRGQLGTGLELQARLDQGQADQDQSAKTQLQLISDRRQRALNALTGAGQLAGDIQGQDYQMAKDKAAAADAIKMFNVQNAQSVQNRNADRTNAAMQSNLAQQQKTADQNVVENNFQQQYNKELDQQRFENEAKKAAGVSGQQNQEANTQVASGQNAAQMWGGIASGIGQLGYGISKASIADDDKSKWKFDPATGKAMG